MSDQPENLALHPAVDDFFHESIQRKPMRAVSVEDASGQLIGGIIVVRGEKEFDLVCQALTKPKSEAEVLAISASNRKGAS